MVRKGYVMTDEHKRKIGEKIKGRKHTEEAKKKMSEGMKGRVPWNKGLTKETDERMQITSEKVSKTLKGKKLSEKHKRKIGEGMKGRILSEESRQKISESLKGHNVSEETRKKISKAFTGRKLSEEHKKNISESIKGENHPLFGKTGENSPNWKGDDVNAHQLHKRVRNVKSIPEVCDLCHQKIDKNGTTKLELSNIKNHKYTDNPDDYQYVHHSCHWKYDNNIK